MRFWLIELPAMIVNVIFGAYGIFLAVITLLCFGCFTYSLIALWMGWPRIW